MSVKNKQSKKKINHKKHGGALADDLKTLAVPFAILLAKQGLEDRKKKSISNKSNTKSPSSSKSPTSFRRKTTMTGGNCGPCNGAGLTPNTQTGGKMKKLSKAIDNFLKKY